MSNSTMLDKARQVFVSAQGNEREFIRLMQGHGLTKNGAQAYYTKCLQLAVEGARRVAGRKVTVVIELTLQEHEDVQQTAELAVDLLNKSIDNNVVLVSVREEQ